MRRIAPLAVLLLAGCGGGAPVEDAPNVFLPPTDGLVFVVLDTGLERDRGWYDRLSGTGRVRVGPCVSTWVQASVLAHELGHAMGLGHSPDLWCLMSPEGASLRWDCPQEVAAALLAPWPMRVRSQLPDRSGLVMAVEWWNARLGRAQFVMED